ncbi:hypothetical protein ABT026_01450 [Streptomyces sp. NPDC002734]|uniref:hypothetical protein n=1 Tax=Streptomyces sp. NPDC002734 TaxID=3154426 RepID=UPI0033327F6B
MRVRRALAVAAATAVVAPLTLLSAPAAFAGDPAPSRSASAAPTRGQDATADPGDGTGDATAAPGDSPAPVPDPVPASESPAAGDEQPERGTPGTGAGETRKEAVGDLPDHALCDRSEVDEGLRTKVTGLPRRIEAGSGWDVFRFTVTNDTGKDLDRLWLDLAVTYQENPELLAEGLAEIQYRSDGRWSDEEYHRWPGSTGSYSDVLEHVPAGATFTADLRIRIREDAPAGASWAYTDVVYDEDMTCFRGKDNLQEFTVVAADADPSRPPRPAPSRNGRPTPSGPSGHDAEGGDAADGGTRSQRGPDATSGSGSLAATGAGDALPPVAAAGAAAGAVGAAGVLAVRRRRASAHT